MKVAFAGTPEFAAVILRSLLAHGVRPALVLTQPDRPSGRGRKLQPSPVKQIAEAEGLDLLQPKSLRASKPAGQASLAEVMAEPMDLLVVAAYGLILPKALLDHPTYGAVNVHASLLPRWRGAAPVERAIMAGDAETGATLMQMDEGLDTGAIISKQSCSCLAPRTGKEVALEIAELGAELLRTHLSALRDNPESIQRTPQDDEHATLAPKLTPADSRVDWQASPEDIVNQVRALCERQPVAAYLAPESGAPIRVRILAASVVPHEVQSTGGSILPSSKKTLWIACGSGAIQVDRLQLSIGKGRPQSAGEAKNGYPELLAEGLTLLSDPPDPAARS